MNYYFRSTDANPKYECHFHSVYEIYYFISGDADYMVEGKEYHLTPHSLLLLAPHVLHGVRVNTDAEYARYYIYVSDSDLSPERRFLLSALPTGGRHSRQEIFFEHVENYGLESIFQNLMELECLPVEKQDTIRPVFVEALLAKIRLMCESLHPSEYHSSAPSKIAEIIRYINQHSAEEISLDFLSEKFYVSKYYMNRAFKKAMGTTVIDYLLQRRVLLGKQYLKNGETAARTAELVGFADYSSFYRAYKKVLGKSPMEDLISEKN